MKDWYDYRFARASRFRADGWSLSQLAEHFELPRIVVAAWFAPPKKRTRRRNHCGYRETGSRDATAHQTRVHAHKRRVELGL